MVLVVLVYSFVSSACERADDFPPRAWIQFSNLWVCVENVIVTESVSHHGEFGIFSVLRGESRKSKSFLFFLYQNTIRRCGKPFNDQSKSSNKLLCVLSRSLSSCWWKKSHFAQLTWKIGCYVVSTQSSWYRRQSQSKQRIELRWKDKKYRNHVGNMLQIAVNISFIAMEDICCRHAISLLLSPFVVASKVLSISSEAYKRRRKTITHPSSRQFPFSLPVDMYALSLQECLYVSC